MPYADEYVEFCQDIVNVTQRTPSQLGILVRSIENPMHSLCEYEKVADFYKPEHVRDLEPTGIGSSTLYEY